MKRFTPYCALTTTLIAVTLTGCQQTSFTSNGGFRKLGLGGGPNQGGSSGGSPTDPRPGDNNLTEGAEAAIKVVWRAPESTEHDFGPWRRGLYKFEIKRIDDASGSPDQSAQSKDILSFDSSSSRSSLEDPDPQTTENVIRCGQKNYFELTITADGQSKPLGDWSQELISVHYPTAPSNASDWEEFIRKRSGQHLTGTNQTIFLGGFDHGVPNEKCAGSNFVCDDREWNNRDDFQGIFTMDLSKCEGNTAAGTEIHFKGMQGQ